MLHWLAENLGTILISLGVLLVAGLAARSVYRNKKQGGGCAGCQGCHHPCDHSQ